MDRKTLIGFILIGLILLFWPSYLELLSPQETEQKSSENPVVAEELLEKYSGENISTKTPVSNDVNVVETVIDGGLYVATVSSAGGGSITSFKIKNHLKK